MTGAVTGWGIPFPHTNIGSRIRAATLAIIASADERRRNHPKREPQPFYPAARPPMFEEAAMAREMYRL